MVACPGGLVEIAQDHGAVILDHDSFYQRNGSIDWLLPEYLRHLKTLPYDGNVIVLTSWSETVTRESLPRELRKTNVVEKPDNFNERFYAKLNR